jgi:hypothetical protein
LKVRHLWTAAVMALSCAKMVAPDGGPEDKTPPDIVSVEPTPGTGYTDLRLITVGWSERLEQSSASVFVYPPIEHRLEVSGSTMRIELQSPPGPGPLVVHIPREISDRRGNQFGYSRDLVYTSSDTLPSGRIEVAMSRQGGGNLSQSTLVELYRGSSLVRRTTPDSSSSAVVDWLEPGEYRLLCYEDPDRSYLWNPEAEAGYDTSVALASGDTLMIDVILTVVDTVGPILTEISPMDSYHLRLVFNEDVSYDSFGTGDVSITDSLGEPVPISGFWLSGGISAPSVILETHLIPSSGMTVRLSGVDDLMGNPSRPDSLEFFGVDSMPADTFRVRSFFPGPGSDNAHPGGPFLISFSYWVHPDSLSRKLVLQRVADSTTVEGTIRAVDGRSFEYYPEHQLIGEQQYRFVLEPGLGTLWGDTLSLPFSWSFSTLWGDEPGSISGRITGYAGSPVLLQMRRTGGDAESRVTYVSVGPGEYEVDDVPAGRYTIAAFVDSDGGGTWNGMEPYGTFPGVVLVQPGLITRDIDVDILP